MRLIDADELIRFYFDDEDGNKTFEFIPAEFIDNAPTIEAEPTKHGRWEQVEVVHDRKDAKIQDWQQAKCSVCGKWHTTPYMYYLKLDNYCPNCGADMREVEE